METNNIKDYKGYIGKKVKGFKFDTQHTCEYITYMDNYIGVVGTIDEMVSYCDVFGVDFGDGVIWYYPADLVIKQLNQKEELVEIMEKDEESGVYDEDDSAEPIIKKGDIYRCIKDYTMERGNVAYKKGQYYVSERDECLTDEGENAGHIMILNNEFYEHFTKLERKPRYFVGESSSNKENDMVNNPNNFKEITDSIASLLQYKNEKYGNSALEPIEVFGSKCKVGTRIDDKLSRIKNSSELNKNDVVDLIGYAILICKEKGWNNFDEFKD